MSTREDPTHISWRAMRERCNNPNHKYFARYGGRGITVCDRWARYANFLADMGPRPKGLSLDRIDNDGNYEPGNVRWATRSVQRRNRHQPPLSPTCGKGHKFTPANTRWKKNGTRICIACAKTAWKSWAAVNRPRKGAAA